MGEYYGSHLSYTSGQLELNQDGGSAAPDCPALLIAVAELQLLCTTSDNLGGSLHCSSGETQDDSTLFFCTRHACQYFDIGMLTAFQLGICGSLKSSSQTDRCMAAQATPEGLTRQILAWLPMFCKLRRAHSEGVLAAPGHKKTPQAERQYACNWDQEQRPLLEAFQHAPVRHSPPCCVTATFFSSSS